MQGQKAIPCLGSHAGAVNLVVCQPAAAVIIIIHSRQIVMNQGIGMHAFQSAGSIYIKTAVHAKYIQYREKMKGRMRLPPASRL